MTTKKRRPKVGPYKRKGPMTQFKVYLAEGTINLDDSITEGAEHYASMRKIARFWFAVKAITEKQKQTLLSLVDRAEQEAA